ncbi:hypothetical protein TWF730_008107 [Orbilia blumenaviensis]|uniref:Uncharacterized protein n=1 Tax=Orbilia blumenaviensis TaxID=1796055 RepID=A0AAV9VCP4_9PEZI
MTISLMMQYVHLGNFHELQWGLHRNEEGGLATIDVALGRMANPLRAASKYQVLGLEELVVARIRLALHARWGYIEKLQREQEQLRKDMERLIAAPDSQNELTSFQTRRETFVYKVPREYLDLDVIAEKCAGTLKPAKAEEEEVEKREAKEAEEAGTKCQGSATLDIGAKQDRGSLSSYRAVSNVCLYRMPGWV